jgi:NADPH-dependent curcumin reductase CurA
MAHDQQSDQQSVNRQVRLASRPSGLPTADNWEHTSEPVPEPGDSELLVRVLYISLDPAMRGWMNEGRSYIPPVGIGEVMRAGAVGVVQASNNPKFAVGDHVSGTFGVQEYVLSDGAGVVKVDPSAASLPTYLGALGMPGLTAYFGLFDVGAVKAGETVVVSGAAGAVGTVAGQLAKIQGCTVVGIAGGPEKCRWLTEELGFDVAIDYKNADVRSELKAAAPNGVDVYFDNVGGPILEAVLGRLAMHARVVLCGAVSQYNSDGGMTGPRNYMNLLVNRARMEGFVVFDYAKRYKEGVAQMSAWMQQGKLAAHEDIAEGGVADFPDTLLRLFRGENLGKLVLKVADA